VARCAWVLERSAVLNGIAYRPADHTLWLTGKLWPRLFEVDLSELLTTHAGLGIQVAATSQPPSCAQPGTVSPTPSLTISPTASPTPCEGGPTTLAPSLATLAPSASAPTQATLAPTASALGPACRGVDCLPVRSQHRPCPCIAPCSAPPEELGREFPLT
jgi:hypothetical protein